MPSIILIAALSKNHVIGNKGKLPWNIPEDFAHFKNMTLGCPVVMGRKTWESLHHKPLEGRWNIVLSRWNLDDEGVTVCHNLDELFALIKNEPKVFIIGGENLYHQMLPYADQMILTYIKKTYEGDTYFPRWCDSEWEKVSEIEGHSTSFHDPFTYQTLRRIT